MLTQGSTVRYRKLTMSRDIVVILHNIRSAHNVGSIFRTADAAGISKIYCTGYTPAPLDRFGRPQQVIAKTALGAEQTVAWERIFNLRSLVARLKRDGRTIAAVEQCAGAYDYRNIPKDKKKNSALLFGNEVRGLSPQTLHLCEYCIEIPMRGGKESLNVSVAAGIILFELTVYAVLPLPSTSRRPRSYRKRQGAG